MALGDLITAVAAIMRLGRAGVNGAYSAIAMSSGESISMITRPLP